MLKRIFTGILLAIVIGFVVTVALLTMMPQLPGIVSIGIGFAVGYGAWRLDIRTATPDFDYDIVEGKLAIEVLVTETLASSFIVNALRTEPQKRGRYLVEIDLVTLGSNRPMTLRLRPDAKDTRFIREVCVPQATVHIFVNTADSKLAHIVGVGNPKTKKAILTRRA